jgi:SAM-dependent methyltransferase
MLDKEAEATLSMAPTVRNQRTGWASPFLQFPKMPGRLRRPRFNKLGSGDASIDGPSGVSYPSARMSTFFRPDYNNLISRPNGRDWWHSIPLPDGNRIAGAHDDHNVQLKLWQNLYLNPSDIGGKRVLDVGANDGFFTIAPLLAGASLVTAINLADWHTYPENLLFACKQWDVAPEVIVGDFQTHDFQCSYDLILFLGVLYHLENIFAGMRRLHELLSESGTVYLETQMSLIESTLPIYEAASDVYPTIAEQNKEGLRINGISNFLFPNQAAIHNLARSYDFTCERLRGPYTRDNSSRGIFRLKKRSEQ